MACTRTARDARIHVCFMDGRSRPVITVIAVTAALVAGIIAYLLYDVPDDSVAGLRMQEQAAQRLRTGIHSIEDLSYQFIANEDLNDILNAYGKRPNRYDGALANLSFSRFLESQRIVSALLEEAFFLDYDEIDRIPLTMTEDFLRPEITAVRRFVWNRAVEADGMCVWMDDSFPVHGERYVIAARFIKRLRTGAPIGILVLLTNSRRASGLLETPAAEKNVAPGPELGLVVSNSGSILAASDESVIGKPVAEVLENSSGFDDIVSRAQESGRFNAMYSDRRVLALFSRIAAKGPYLISIYADRLGTNAIRRFVASLLFALAALFIVWFGARSTGILGSEPMSARRTGDPVDGLPPGLPSPWRWTILSAWNTNWKSSSSRKTRFSSSASTRMTRGGLAAHSSRRRRTTNSASQSTYRQRTRCCSIAAARVPTRTTTNG